MRNDRQRSFSLECYTHPVSCVQVREAYLQFMITIAKMIREDKNTSKDDSFVEEEMAKVMELETEIANVSQELLRMLGGGGERKQHRTPSDKLSFSKETVLFAYYLSVYMSTCMQFQPLTLVLVDSSNNLVNVFRQLPQQKKGMM